MAAAESKYPMLHVPPIDLVVDSQYGEGRADAKLEARWKVYERAVPFVDPLLQMYQMARQQGVEPTATILDAGCYDASDLMTLGTRYGHTGTMYGVDPFIDPNNKRLLDYYATMPDGPPLIPVASRVEDIGFNPRTIGLILAKFMLYHVDDQREVLSQFQQWLTPDGVLLVATSGQNNKPRHRAFERSIAEFLGAGVKPPPQFNQKFTAEQAGAMLEEHFDIAAVYPDPLDLRLSFASYGPDDYHQYLDSLRSMAGSFSPRCSPDEFEQAIQAVVIPVILAEIGQNGRFTETIDRFYFACKNKPAVQS
jgi:SAM-dependent methyltransferase